MYVVCDIDFFFFFSSRRRHTRCSRDWSSDVCSSDLDVDKPFLMSIEDVFSITGRGTVVTGRVERGVLAKMSEVEIVGLRDTRKTVATDLEMFRKLLDEVRAGDNVGILLRGVDKEELERGQVLAKPGSIT